MHHHEKHRMTFKEGIMRRIMLKEMTNDKYYF